MKKLNKGTKEFLIVLVVDRLNEITTLTGLTCTYYVEDHTGEKVIADNSPTTDGLIAECLVDTSALDPGSYRLFMSVEVGNEKPLLGPFEFAVD